MSGQLIADENLIFEHILKGLPVIDVRSAAEFSQGSIPNSVNIPILNDEERHLVGLCYKQKGQEEAIKLGHDLVSGENLKNKLQAWSAFVRENPETILTCFRGGLRSQKAQEFLAGAGIERPRIEGGYKKIRNTLLDQITLGAGKNRFIILSGTTGSGKTHLLNAIGKNYPAIDLEGLAHHRGSAFGAWEVPQPAQADFENRLAIGLVQKGAVSGGKPILLEDESRMIGHRHIPEVLFSKMRESQVVVVQESLQTRTDNIFVDYISSRVAKESPATRMADILNSYRNSVQKIKNKLGGLRAQEILKEMDDCEAAFNNSKELEKNKIWIEKLLVWYYDPMYLGSLEKRSPQVAFRGSSQEIKDYFSSL